MYEIPVGTLDAEFFVKIQGQLDVLVGPSKTPAEPAPATPVPLPVPSIRERQTAASAGPASSASVPVIAAAAMSIEGQYVPSALEWVRDQIETYERSGGTEANTLRDSGIPIIVVTMKGHRSGNVRKIALMRVEHQGEYALVASMGGATADTDTDSATPLTLRLKS